MTKIVLCDGDWSYSALGGLQCSGEVTQAVYTVPIEYTSEMAMEAMFQGFSITLPVMAVVFGGRLLLKTLLNRGN